MWCRTFKCQLLSGYQLHCQIGRDRTLEDEASYISDVTATIFTDGVAPAGHFEGHIVHLAEMYENGDDPAWVCDGHSQSLSDLYCYLLLEGRPLAGVGLDEDADIFHLERLWIDFIHRGMGLGLMCCAALLALVQPECGYAAMKPFPLQWTGRVAENEAQFQKDRQKLISFYRPLGFIRAPDTDEFHYRPLEQSAEILGFRRKRWIKAKKIKLPSMPDDLPF